MTKGPRGPLSVASDATVRRRDSRSGREMHDDALPSYTSSTDQRPLSRLGHQMVSAQHHDQEDMPVVHSSITGSGHDFNREGVTHDAVDEVGDQDLHDREKLHTAFHLFHTARRSLEQHFETQNVVDRPQRNCTCSWQPKFCTIHPDFASGSFPEMSSVDVCAQPPSSALGCSQPPPAEKLYSSLDDLTVRLVNTTPIKARLGTAPSCTDEDVVPGLSKSVHEEDDSSFSEARTPAPLSRRASYSSPISDRGVIVGTARMMPISRPVSAVYVDVNRKASFPFQSEGLDQGVSLDECIHPAPSTKQQLEDDTSFQRSRPLLPPRASAGLYGAQERTDISKTWYARRGAPSSLHTVTNVPIHEQRLFNPSPGHWYHSADASASPGAYQPWGNSSLAETSSYEPSRRYLRQLPLLPNEARAAINARIRVREQARSLRLGKRVENIPPHNTQEVARRIELWAQEVSDMQQAEWACDPFGNLWKPLPLN